MTYLVGGAAVLGLTVLVHLGLVRLLRVPGIPKMARLRQKMFAALCLMLPMLAILAAGVVGGMLLRGLLGFAPAASNDSTLLLMVAGLLVPALLAGYLAMAALYLAVWGKKDLVPAEAAKKASKLPGGYKRLEKRAYQVFTGLFFLSGCLYVWGVTS